MADAARMARVMWTLFEPIHAVIYFAPEGRSAFEQAGLRGFWRGYFAGRAAPLGPASAAVVGASFFNFAPAFVGRAIPGIWELISPEEALRTRVAGATEALGRLLVGREAEVAAAADLLWRAADELDCAGRVLAAANVALGFAASGDGLAASGDGFAASGDGLAASGDGRSALARLWQAATIFREHRGDGHWAAMAAADVDGCEALVLRCGLDMRRETMQPIRGWTDEQWDAARARLADRGWVGASGELTAAGRDTHAAVEAATDRAAARPWARVGAQAAAELATLLTPLAQACTEVVPYPSPIGVPAPGTVR